MKDENILKGDFGEAAVNEIASNTYLKYWCYPSPKDENGDKKEICDLLILFKEHAIIISVKNYEFKGKYIRYFRSTLGKAVAQIQGAERKLFLSDSEIVFLHPITGTHKFDSTQIKSIHRIIVNLSTDALFYPGSMIDKRGNSIHVFNWFAFLKTVNELNTISDFAAYLTERERIFAGRDLILLTGNENDWDSETGIEFHNFMVSSTTGKSQTVLLSGNELDLLADYLNNNRNLDNVFSDTESTHLFVQFDNKWSSYLQKKEVVRKKEEEQLSYFIDDFIKKEVLHYSDGNRINIATELLSLNRFERRILGQSLNSFIIKFRNSSDHFTARRFNPFGELVVGFLMHGNGINLEDVLNLMKIASMGYSYWDDYKAKRIIMIGIDSNLTQTKFSYYPNVQPLSEEDEDDLKTKLKILNWFENIDMQEKNYKEYPED